MVIGVLVLLAVAGAWDSHVDEILFRSQLRSRPVSNRMAPNTALNFLLRRPGGLLLLDVESRHGRRPAQFLTLTATCVSLLALVGYFLAVLAFYNVPTKVPMALNTSLCFAALCIGTLCAAPRPRADGDHRQRHGRGRGGAAAVARGIWRAAVARVAPCPWAGDGTLRPPMGLSLFALGNIVAFNLLVWWTARLLFRLDEHRRVAEERLQQQNVLLEQSVRAEREAIAALKDAQSQLVQSEKLAGLGADGGGRRPRDQQPAGVRQQQRGRAPARRQRRSARLLRLYQRGHGRGRPALESSHAALLADLRDLCETLDLAYTLTQPASDCSASSRDGLQRIKRIVEDLRNFARLDESDLHEVDVNDGVRSTANIIAGRKAASGACRSTWSWRPLPPVACYPAKINQVVMNLLANAIDASPTGGTVDRPHGAGRRRRACGSK